MKELTKMTIYNDEYEIEINRYLTYAQIQQICNLKPGLSVKRISTFFFSIMQQI